MSADDLVERLERLSKLKADGLLSDEEFSRAKETIIGATPQPVSEPSGASTASAGAPEEERAASVRQVRVPASTPSLSPSALA